MTAEAMFKKLGFKKALNESDIENNKEWGVDWCVRYRDDRGTVVSFDMLDMDVAVYNEELGMDCSITYDLCKAINKQFEEFLSKGNRHEEVL